MHQFITHEQHNALPHIHDVDQGINDDDRPLYVQLAKVLADAVESKGDVSLGQGWHLTLTHIHHQHRPGEIMVDQEQNGMMVASPIKPEDVPDANPQEWTFTPDGWRVSKLSPTVKSLTEDQQQVLQGLLDRIEQSGQAHRLGIGRWWHDGQWQGFDPETALTEVPGKDRDMVSLAGSPVVEEDEGSGAPVTHMILDPKYHNTPPMKMGGVRYIPVSKLRYVDVWADGKKIRHENESYEDHQIKPA